MITDYLCIEPFLRDALPARMLHAAFELGVIDTLAAHDSVSAADLLSGSPIDASGLQMLLPALIANSVITTEDHRFALTSEFRRTLPFASLLRVKLEFAAAFAADFLAHLPQLLTSADAFMERSQLFELFDYSRALELTDANIEHTARWMTLTTALTCYEAPACAAVLDLAPHQRLLDLGGNSGRFAIELCRQQPALHATICDLPVVCHIGEKWTATEPEAARIRFQPLDFLSDDWPAGHDLITFKSVLHDWPEDAAAELIRRAFFFVEPGGRLVIFERQRLDFTTTPLHYGQLLTQLFFRSYREPSFYLQTLQAAGFEDIQLLNVPLEVPFLLITGRKAAVPKTVGWDQRSAGLP
jgi:SAM-dependent methyltransferase